MFTTSFNKEKQLTLCCYKNKTNRIQIGRISNITSWFFERVIWPSQRIIFEAPLEAELEIHTSEMISAILSEKISCDRLRIYPLSNSKLVNTGVEQAEETSAFPPVNKKL